MLTINREQDRERCEIEFFVWSIKGTGAEIFAKWICDHFTSYRLAQDVHITPDGRFHSGTNKTVIQSDNTVYLIQDQQLVPETDGTNILILDDVAATFAARRTKPKETHNLDPLVRALWKDYALEWMRKTKNLTNPICVMMNEFRNNETYRDSIRRQLHLPDKEVSFTPLDIHGNQHQRGDYHKVWNCPEYRSAFDAEVLALSEMIFGPPPGEIISSSERSAESYHYEGAKHYNAGRFPQAVKCFRRSLAREDTTQTNQSLAAALTANRQFEEAFQVYENLKPQWEKYCVLPYEYGMALQAAGKRQESLRYIEHRFTGYKGAAVLISEFGMERKWRGGDSLDGRKLLLWFEQGDGDQIQHARYIKAIQKKYPTVQITAAVQPELVELFKTIPGIEVKPKYDAKCEDLWMSALSCPLFFEDEGIPSPEAFIVNEAAPLDGDFKIGVCWQGSWTHGEDDWRSCNRELLSPLAEVGTLVNLQHDLDSPWTNPGIKTFLDLAKVINGVDVVVSVDTSVAHLAGALGKKCLLLLSWKPDFRWTTEGETTPWYPNHTLLRQDKMNEWQPVIHRAKEMIRGIDG